MPALILASCSSPSKGWKSTVMLNDARWCVFFAIRNVLVGAFWFGTLRAMKNAVSTDAELILWDGWSSIALEIQSSFLWCSGLMGMLLLFTVTLTSWVCCRNTQLHRQWCRRFWCRWSVIWFSWGSLGFWIWFLVSLEAPLVIGALEVICFLLDEELDEITFIQSVVLAKLITGLLNVGFILLVGYLLSYGFWWLHMHFLLNSCGSWVIQVFCVPDAMQSLTAWWWSLLLEHLYSLRYFNWMCSAHCAYGTVPFMFLWLVETQSRWNSNTVIYAFCILTLCSISWNTRIVILSVFECFVNTSGCLCAIARIVK